MDYPEKVSVETEQGKWIALSENNGRWENSDTGASVVIQGNMEDFRIMITSPRESVSHIQLSWENKFPDETLYLGDTFERSYGEMRFEPLNPEAVYHWYFMASSGEKNVCCGVKTQPNALCAWTVNRHSVDLWLDIRNGSLPLSLGERCLEAATVVIKEYRKKAFESLSDFCGEMCVRQCRYTEPVIGGNDWYYAYGNNSKDLVLENCRLLHDLCENIEVKPWMVVDDGWQAEHSVSYNGGPWDRGNLKFGDMRIMAEEMKHLGVRPGIWIRPLLTNNPSMQKYALRSGGEQEYYLDISCKEVLSLVKEDIRRIVKWGFEMIKHDFSTYDIFGKWGPQMSLGYASGPLVFHDRTKTTAELIKQFYRIIRETAGEAVIIGCNTISHLSAGIFELMRTGDDISGQDFQRTRKMGVNTLAFRMVQNKKFYQTDADCVGITSRISWEKNKKWMDLLAVSGTPLFISCNPQDLTEGMKRDIKKALETAAQIAVPAIPEDWKWNPCPEQWHTQAGDFTFAWYQIPRDYYEHM